MIILLVEDDPKVASLVKSALEREQYTVEATDDGDAALQKVSVNDYDLVILDIVLPGASGLQILKKIREMGLQVPILLLTGKKLSEDKIRGLNSGADDYMVKPFDILEFLARVRALSRRMPNLNPDKIEVADLVVDGVSHEIHRGGREIKLTGKEYRILEYLIRNKNKLCTRTMINEHIWGFNYVKSNVIDVYITKLRQKIDKAGQKPLIQTVHGVGYKIKV